MKASKLLIVFLLWFSSTAHAQSLWVEFLVLEEVSNPITCIIGEYNTRGVEAATTEDNQIFQLTVSVMKKSNMYFVTYILVHKSTKTYLETRSFIYGSAIAHKLCTLIPDETWDVLSNWEQFVSRKEAEKVEESKEQARYIIL